jgi:phosphopantothenoylcysteine decarboxylase/phosphopantothenate--cysteine ligase
LHILVGVTGGIAAYKAAGVIRGFTELGHTVKVVPTQNALRFIGATTLEALSHNVVDSDLYTDVDSVKHIALAQEANLIVVAPATASFIARYAHGVADDLLLNVLLATNAKVVIAPAMHTEMWLHPATVTNIQTLKSRGVVIIEPATGRLTGDDSGPGRLPEPEAIVTQALGALQPQDLLGKTITVAAGGTREPIDAVRFIGNRSSGKQGLAIADAALARGANVNLIAINIESESYRFRNVLRVSTTAELSKALDDLLPVSDALFMPAAVSDFRVAHVEEGKLSRHETEEMNLKLISNPDLLSGLSVKRSAAGLKTLLIGFAAEVLTSVGDRSELAQRADKKRLTKNVDLVVANDVTGGAVFDQDSNQVIIVSAVGSVESQGTKLEVANEILNETIKLFG